MCESMFIPLNSALALDVRKNIGWYRTKKPLRLVFFLPRGLGGFKSSLAAGSRQFHGDLRDGRPSGTHAVRSVLGRVLLNEIDMVSMVVIEAFSANVF